MGRRLIIFAALGALIAKLVQKFREYKERKNVNN